MSRQKTWYVVMNGHEARILHDLETGAGVAHHETKLGGPQRRPRETATDKPTRSFSSGAAGRRSGVEPGSDPLLEDARAFLREVFAFLEKSQRAGAFEDLVLIGSPDIVGLWREMVPKGLTGSVSREVIRNLLSTPPGDLVPAVREALAAP